LFESVRIFAYPVDGFENFIPDPDGIAGLSVDEGDIPGYSSIFPRAQVEILTWKDFGVAFF
jgi:hypothetical protein